MFIQVAFFRPDQKWPLSMLGLPPPPLFSLQARTHQQPQRPGGNGTRQRVHVRQLLKNQRLDHRSVCPGTSTVAEEELFDLVGEGQAKGPQSAKQIRLSLLRPVTLFTPALPHHLADDTGLS